MENGDKLYFCAKMLLEIAENIQRQTAVKPNISNPSTAIAQAFGWKQFIKEFCTIRVATSRRGGHTYALSKFIQNDFQNNVIVVSNTRMMSGIAEREIKAKGVNLDRVWFTSAGASTNKLHGIAQIDAVLVDVASVIKPAVIDEIIDTILPVCAIQGRHFWIMFFE